ncbi:MAG: sulfur oxidation c-type cytochrome SoxA [Pseudolabrys sp.]|nr:sulfur oxidation c-type cytochrome SoxA [Pseudolabrys sp.]MDP2294635.1 sulfur oxidation c-type cytochrome SoxA [Pseudolabrys sp.]
MRAGILTAVAMGIFVAAGGSDANAQAKRPAPLDTGPSAAATPWKRYPGWPAADYSKYNTLGKLATAPAPKEPIKLTGPVEGDAAKGARLVADRSRGGSCLACHVMGPAGNADLPGNVAPDLSEIGNAGREDEWLYNYVFDARVYNPETVMPPWGSHGFFSDAEIRDMVAFLKTLKAPAVFKTVLDDPEKRPQPIEKRDNLDPLENPGMWSIDKGQELWKIKTSAGFSCNTCHSDPAASFKTWAASMPKWEPRLNKVLGVEEFVTRHAKATTGDNWLMETPNNRAMSVYLNFLANGAPIKVDTESAEAKAAIARGAELSKRKVGALNLACTDCHGIAVNKWIRGQWMGEPKGQADHFPTWRTSLQTVWDIRQRFQWCSVNIRGDELPPDAKEYGDLELYVKMQSQGLKLSVPGIRH